MPRPGQPLSEDHKAKLKAGIAEAKARREAGEPALVRVRRPYVRRTPASVTTTTRGSTPIATIDGAARDALALVLDELRAIRVLLDTRLPGWTMSPAMPAAQVKAAEEIAEKVRFPVGTPVTRIWKEPAASVEARLDAAIQDAERVPMPGRRAQAPIYNESPRRPETPYEAVSAMLSDPDRNAAAEEGARRMDEFKAIYDGPDDPMADLAAELEEYAALDELPPPPPDEESVWRPRVEMFRNFGMWMEQDWGAPPGKRGCGAPDWLLDEVGIAKVAG